MAQEKLSRLETFICSSLGGQGWKIKVGAAQQRLSFQGLKISFEKQVTADEKVEVVSTDGEEVDLLL